MPSTTVLRIKERLGIAEVLSAYIKLEKAGMNFKAKCPFHNEKTPSFFVSPARASYYCFGCGAKGDIFSFVQEFEGLDFPGALKILADKAGVVLELKNKEAENKEERLYHVLEQATVFYQRALVENTSARSYLEKRGLKADTIAAWRLGYAADEWRGVRAFLKRQGFTDSEIEASGMTKASDKGNEPYDRFRSRIMFPLLDVSGRPVAFSGRLVNKSEGEGSPKYLNSPETALFSKSKLLYGMHAAKLAIRERGYSILVEGQMDLLMSHQAHFVNTIASSGTALSVEQLQILSRLSQNIIMAYDADGAGFRASVRSARLALSLGMDIKVAQLPDGLDPADAILKDPSIWARALRDSKHIIDFYTDVVAGRETDLRKLDRLVVSEVLPFVAVLKSPTEQARFIASIAHKTKGHESSLWEDLKRIDPQKVFQEEASAVSVRPAIAPTHRSGRDTAIRRLLGILLLKEKAGDIAYRDMLKERLRIADVTVEKHMQAYIHEHEAIAFEAELYYGDAQLIERDIDELIVSIEREALRAEFETTMEQLALAEQAKDTARVKELLSRCQELGKKLSSGPPDA